MFAELSVSHIHYNMYLIVSSYFHPFEKLTGYHLLLLQRCLLKFFCPTFKFAESGSEFFECLLPLFFLNLKLRKLLFAFLNMQL